VTGANGQIGTELVPYLRKRYGFENVFFSDLKQPSSTVSSGNGGKSNSDGFFYADVTNFDQLAKIVVENRVTWVFHLAALLSAIGEQQPKTAMSVNNTGTENILELARVYGLKVCVPSTIAAFGPTTPQDNTPNLTIMRPTTIYGITKVYNELLGEYYHRRYGVDFRSLRYPGVISSRSMPGGGTTDYAVWIYHQALKEGKYSCFLSQNTLLPMMFMDDCINATIQLMEADNKNLSQRVYNVAGVSFTPEQQTRTIQKYLPKFQIKYEPDFRQQIADTWPKSLDDSVARKDWQWKPKFDLEGITKQMLVDLKDMYGVNIKI